MSISKSSKKALKLHIYAGHNENKTEAEIMVQSSRWTEPIYGCSIGPAYTIPDLATVQSIWTDDAGVTVSVNLYTDEPLRLDQVKSLIELLEAGAGDSPPFLEDINKGHAEKRE